jgi:hypothetical protein
MARRVDHPKQTLADKLFASPLQPGTSSHPIFASQAVAKMACFSYIEGWYNPVRLQFRPGIPLTENLRSRLLHRGEPGR